MSDGKCQERGERLAEGERARELLVGEEVAGRKFLAEAEAEADRSEIIRGAGIAQVAVVSVSGQAELRTSENGGL